MERAGIRLRVIHNGGEAERRPPILFLHGFPEYWAGWEPAFRHLGDEFHIIAPDQRGYGRSDAPPEVDAYQTRELAADMWNVVDLLVGDRPFFLAGHDWGGSIAYAMAIAGDPRLCGLIIANGVHPVCFQRALIRDPAQSRASQYFHILRAPDAAERMSEDGFRRTLGMFEKFSRSAWLTDTDRMRYRDAWESAARMHAMLHWYRASPIVVPKPGEAEIDAPLADGSAARYSVSVPHLVIWGEADEALRPSCLADLDEFAPQLNIIRLADADHWLIHTHGEQIAANIAGFARNHRREG